MALPCRKELHTHTSNILRSLRETISRPISSFRSVGFCSTERPMRRSPCLENWFGERTSRDGRIRSGLIYICAATQPVLHTIFSEKAVGL